MTMRNFQLQQVDSSWRCPIEQGLQHVDPAYLNQLYHSQNWLPGPDKIFNALTMPLNKVNYVLFGESPYPRSESANGYAFWDAAVKELWSPTGLSKAVNRATSLRNIMKMLLVAEGVLDINHTGQDEIAAVNKQTYVQTSQELFQNFIRHGFLLLNATPVLQAGPPQKDARAWQPFMKTLLDELLINRPHLQFILLGRIANAIDDLIPQASVSKLYAEHPYNLSFISNEKVINFFKPFHLLSKEH